VRRDPRIVGEEGQLTDGVFTVHRRSAILFPPSEHPLSFHPRESRSKVHAMTSISRSGGRTPSNRLTTCAVQGCNRPFAVCGGCDRGRRFCSRPCANSARRSSLQRAGRQYQATARGRSLHATRQARYRDRLSEVTRQSRDVEPNLPTNGPKSTPIAVSITAVRAGLCLPPRCAFCHRPGVFLRNGFLDWTPRRRHRRRPSQRTRSVRVQNGHAIRAACAWPFETLRGAG
jgi:hypothetical protein